MDQLPNVRLPKIPKNIPVKVRRPRIPKLFTILTVSTIIVLSFVFKNQIFDLANRTGLFPALRKIGIIRSSAPDFFNALQNQNLSYDFNNDGVISGEDYQELLNQTESDLPELAVSNLTATSGETEAVSDTLALPSVRAFGSDAFNGAATVSYPITLPIGKAGLTPSLSINYSSSSIDDLYLGKKTLWRNDSNSPYQKQAGILGLGWSLGGIQSIARDTNGTLNAPGDDKFILSFVGGSATLSKESGDEYYSVWRTIPNLKIKVERYGRCKTSGSLALCRNHWEVTTGDGTKYIFGSPSSTDNWHTDADPDKDNFSQGSGNDWYRLYEGTTTNAKGHRSWLIFGSDGPGYHGLTYNWYLHSVRSVYDKPGGPDVEVNYTYDIELDTYKGKSYVSSVYPSKISYGKHEVNIFSESREDFQIHDGGDENPRQPFRSKQRVNKIVVKTDGKVRNAYTLDYVYGFDSAKHNESSVVGGQVIHSLLKKITVYSDDPSANSNAKRMPSYTFGYGSNCDSFKNGCPLTSFVNDGTNTQVRTANDFFLKTAENGYGGKVTFEYWGGGSDNAINVKYCKDNKDNGCRTGHMNNTGRHRISAKVTDDGMGNTIRTQYNYTGAGATLGLAFVEGYGDEWYEGKNCCKVSGGKCTGNPSGCRCPGDSSKCFTQISGGWDCRGGTNCTWSDIGSSCCPSDLSIDKVIKCTHPDNGNRYYCIVDDNTRCQSNCKYRSDPFAGYEFLGYPEVETIVYEKNSSSNVVAKTKIFYHQVIESDSCFKSSPLKGMAYKTQTFDANNSSKWLESISKFKVRFGEMFGEHIELEDDALSGYCGTYDPETTVTLVMNTESIAKSVMPNPQLCTKTVTTYGSGPYALPQQVSNWGKISCSDTAQDDTSDRKRENYTIYTTPNEAKWINPLPKESWTSDSDHGTKYGHTKLLYDNQAHGQIGDYGNLTESQTFVRGSKYASNSVSYSSSYPWLVTSSIDANGQTTTTSYETQFNMYPTKVTNSLGHSVSTSYDFNVNDSSHPNNGGVLGVPVKITDPNGATSITVYDDFGRPIETYLPGRKPGSNKPNQVTKYYYFNESAMSPCNASTNCLTGLGKELSGKGPKMMVYQGNLQSDTGTLGKISASHTYYNGIGQGLQTRQLWYEGEASNAGIPVASAGKKDILLSQVYNALGQVTHQSLPYTANPHTSLTSSAFDTRNVVSDSSIKKEIHSYDGFGRSISVASPDGTNQTTSYDVGGNPLKVRLSNENCNDGDPNTLCVTSAITTDAFGQTTLVEENTGSKTLSTRFKYHPLLGTVTETIDTNGNIVSAINYDVLGRKVNMWDIDMSPPGTLGAQSDTESSEVLAGEAIAATCSSWVTMATQVHFDANNNGLFDDGVSNIVQSSEQVCGDFKTIDGIKLRVLGGTVGEWWRAYNSGCHDDKLGIDGEPNINFRPLVQNNNGFQGEVHLDVPLKYKVVASDRCTFDPENNAAINCSFCGNKHVDFLIQEIPPTPTNTPTVTPIPAGKAWAYEYDKVGNLTKQTNPKGQVTTLTYDELYRLKTREVNGTTILSNSYDNCVNGKGKICEKISYDPTSSRELEKKRFEYTKRGQNSKLSKTLSNLPDSQVNGKTFTNSYTYDQGGRILSTNYSFPSGLSLSGETINYTYNRPYLTKIAGTDTYASGAQFNKNGAMVEFISGNGVINSYTYDANNSRLKSLSVQGQNMASEDRLQLSYTYDPIGNITKITDENSAHANTEFNLNQNFTYDPLSRLTEVTGAYTANFSYDDIGNIITKNEGGSSVTLSYSNNSGGFYHRPKTANIQGTQQSFQYDAIGNMTSDGTRTYDYDSNNRLSQTGDATFYYGAGGQRIAKIISGGLNTYYVSPELEIIISSDGKTSWRKNYYFAGKLAAVREGGDVIIPPTPVSGTPTKRPTSTIPPTPAGVPGDANGDKLVDLQDYTVWTTFYNTSTQDGVRAGDFNGNGSVEGRDYITWHNNYSTTPATGTQIPSPSSGQLISNLQENGRGTWNVAADLKVGDIQYSDRTFAFTFIPSEVLGSEWIQTSNDSKSYTGDVLATFKVNSNSKVYIALDDRSNIPSWLSSWTDSGMDIVNNENIPVSFSMYEKDFSSGQTVSLGSIGNTKYGMYSIIVISMGI